MNKYYKDHIKNATEQLGITENQYRRFKYIGIVLRNVYSRNCNGEMSEEEYKKATSEIYELTDKLAESLGLYIYYQTDPRGATIYLSKDVKLDDTNYNKYGYCIY